MLSALLVNGAVGGPGSQSVVKTFVSRPGCVCGGMREHRLIEAIKVQQRHRIGGAHCFRRYPGKCAIALGIAEAARVAEDEQRVAGHRGAHPRPINGVGFMAEK